MQRRLVCSPLDRLAVKEPLLRQPPGVPGLLDVEAMRVRAKARRRPPRNRVIRQTAEALFVVHTQMRRPTRHRIPEVPGSSLSGRGLLVMEHYPPDLFLCAFP